MNKTIHLRILLALCLCWYAGMVRADYDSDLNAAITYLKQQNIIQGGNDGELHPEREVTRAELAKMAFLSLYKGKEPATLVSDNFPSIYPDLQNKSAYYYRYAKALLYLEYQDGVSPFDRNRALFNPSKTIERNLVMKVLLETMNIPRQASTAGNPFADFTPDMVAWGYAAKAYSLGITDVRNYRPYDNCKRGEVFIFLHRILTSRKITIPTPVNSEDIYKSSFFVPANFRPSNANRFLGMESGNFNYYEKDFFNIGGYMPLNFGVTYNSCLTEMPSDLYPLMPVGYAWSHSYNSYMQIVEATEETGKQYVFHNVNGSLLIYDEEMQSVSEGNYTKMEMSRSDQCTLTTPNKTVYRFEHLSSYDKVFYLTSITDINGRSKGITYESGHEDRRVSKVGAFGRELTFEYHAGTDLLKTVTDPMGRKVCFEYGANQELASLTDAKGQTTTFNYGTSDADRGLLKTIRLPRGNVVTNTYQQRKLTSTQTNNNTPTTVNLASDYAKGGSVSKITESIAGGKSLTTTVSMDASGKLTSAKDNQTNDVSIVYGDISNPTLPTLVKNNITGMSTSITYDANGNPTRTVVSGGGLSVTNTMVYNDDNLVTSATDGNGNTSTYEYYRGSLQKVTDPQGNVTTYKNNTYGAPVSITDASGRSVAFSYDSYGNVIESSIPSLDISSKMMYDAASRPVRSTDASGRMTNFSYDANDNLLSCTNAMQNVTRYAYDPNDNLTSITNAMGGVTSYTYDNNDQLTKQSFQGHDKSYAYYDNGSLKSTVRADGTTLDMKYDDANRLIDNDYATFTYNSAGQLSAVNRGGKSIAYAYDGLNRLASVAYDGKTVAYTYDSNSNTTSITYPGGKKVRYAYDELNRVVSVIDWNGAKTTYAYNPDGSMQTMTLPNAVTTRYTYDAGGRMTGYDTKRQNDSVIVAYEFMLDKNSNHYRVSSTEVISETPDLEAEVINYTYNNDNRVVKAGDVTYTYDANGNTISHTGRRMSYDVANNLTHVEGDFSATYEYDGQGLRRSATRGGVTTKYVMSGDNIVAETDGSGAIRYYYVYGPTGLISRISASGETLYYISDYRGSIVAMTDDTPEANVTHSYQYDEFGKVLRAEEKDLNRFRYIGSHGVMYETEDLTFMRARYYDPTLGRFLSEDPVWSTNLYPYCDNNPITMFDPDGRYNIEAAIEYVPEAKEIVVEGIKNGVNHAAKNLAPYAERIKRYKDLLESHEWIHSMEEEAAEDFLKQGLKDIPDNPIIRRTAQKSVECTAQKSVEISAGGYVLAGVLITAISAIATHDMYVNMVAIQDGRFGDLFKDTWANKPLDWLQNRMFEGLDRLFFGKKQK